MSTMASSQPLAGTALADAFQRVEHPVRMAKTLGRVDALHAAGAKYSLGVHWPSLEYLINLFGKIFQCEQCLGKPGPRYVDCSFQFFRCVCARTVSQHCDVESELYSVSAC